MDWTGNTDVYMLSRNYDQRNHYFIHQHFNQGARRTPELVTMDPVAWNLTSGRWKYIISHIILLSRRWKIQSIIFSLFFA